MLTKMLCEVKQKFFGRVGATKFCRANAPKKMTVSFLWLQKQKRLLFYQFFGGTSKDKIDDQYKFILQKMKVSYDQYETLLHNFATNSVRQVLAKFLASFLEGTVDLNNRFQGVVQNLRELLLLTD